MDSKEILYVVSVGFSFALLKKKADFAARPNILRFPFSL